MTLVGRRSLVPPTALSRPNSGSRPGCSGCSPGWSWNPLKMEPGQPHWQTAPLPDSPQGESFVPLYPAQASRFNLWPLFFILPAQNWSPSVSCHLKTCLSVLYYTTHLLKHQEKYPPCRRLYLPLADNAGTDYIVTNLRLTGHNSCISKCYFSFYLFVWMYYEYFASTVLSILFSGQCNVFR